jgi:NAD kinase
MSFSEEQKELIAKCKEKVTQEISQRLLEDTVTDEVERIVKDSYREAKADRKTTLCQIGQDVHLLRTARYFNK